MNKIAALLVSTAVIALVCPGHALAAEANTFGWRGNWTGLFPDADPPVQWTRTARGVVAGISCQAAKPAEAAPPAGRPLDRGLIRDWLILGPVPAADSVKDFEQEQVAGEAALQPAEGDKVGEIAWQRFQIVKKPKYDRWGTTELDWAALSEAIPYKPNQVVYAHAYLYCLRPGKAVAVAEHTYGMKVWVNGKPAYCSPQRESGLGSYVGISRQKKDLFHSRSPKFEVVLNQGWNRLLLKSGTYNAKGWRSQEFILRLFDPEPVPYEQKNILWMTRLPERTNAVPIVVGDRVFTVAEPDELLCLDKRTGKVLWRALNGYYEATPEAERAAHPAMAKIAPLAEELRQTADYERSLELRRTIRDLLLEADKKKYRMKWDGHLADHFGIVGFSTTPVSDGRRVYVYFGHGVAACYDLDGSRKWIRRLEADEIRYSCSPALVGGKLAVVFGGLHALDAETGALAWSKPEAGSIASLIPLRVKGTDAVTTRDGEIFRASDGKLLWKNPSIGNGGGWGAPTFVDNKLYITWHGIGGLIVADFSEVTGDEWKPKLRSIEVKADHHRPNGEWLDRSSPGSPLIYEGIYYGMDEYGMLYAVDLKSGETLYQQDVGFDELHHYNAIGVAAGPTLGGKHVYVLDNQGTCVVFEPGPIFKQVALNRIETVVQRDWPIPPQEILSNGAPVFDGQCMYLRGEQWLYCIGNKRP